MYKKLLVVVCLIFFIVGCDRRREIYFYSPDKSQCITLIDENDIRYIINGKHQQLPDNNYVKLSTQEIDRIDDCFYVCWKSIRFEWEVVIPHSEILESKLDTSRFSFSTSLPTDDRGIPTGLKFRKDRCAIFVFELMRLTPPDNSGAIVEIKQSGKGFLLLMLEFVRDIFYSTE